MKYVKLKYTHPGIMGFIEKSGDEITRYTDTEGNTIAPDFDETLNLAQLYPEWGLAGHAYAYVSFLSGGLITYQDEFGGNYAGSGDIITDEYLIQNGFSENHLIDKNPPRLDWMK